jgi:hypothetical protein
MKLNKKCIIYKEGDECHNKDKCLENMCIFTFIQQDLEHYNCVAMTLCETLFSGTRMTWFNDPIVLETLPFVDFHWFSISSHKPIKAH